MKYLSKLTIFFTFLLVSSLISHKVIANDDLFPAKESAKRFIDFDNKGFLIHGKRTYIVSAGMEYARVPRPLWKDRLLRFKRAGFNCVEIYVFWNYHESQTGKFDFTDNRDLDAFLKLAKELGLYIIVRVGPYCCAEWDSGGFPIWLRFIPDLQVRTNNPAFMKCVSRYFNALLPIVVKNQISKGGSVILVQLENEHGFGWGTEGLWQPYFPFLQKTAVDAGVDVPYFFSGMHHGHDPAGGSPWNSSDRKSPWITTEFWCNWYDRYGSGSPWDLNFQNRETWRIIAYGGNGYNYYMAHGGSDFDYFNNDEDGSSYDYGSAVGETGDLRKECYLFKRAAWFARSFEDILETSDNASNEYRSAATNNAIKVSARTSPHGTICFLENDGSATQQTKVRIGDQDYPQQDSLELHPGDIVPVVMNYSIAPGVTLATAPTRIYGILQQGNTITLVIYGKTGSSAELYFNSENKTSVDNISASHITVNGTNKFKFSTTYPATDKVILSTFRSGGKKIRIMAVNDETVDRTWFASDNGKRYIITGAHYVGDIKTSQGKLQLTIEKPWDNAQEHAINAYDENDAPLSFISITPAAKHVKKAILTKWFTNQAFDQIAATNNASWLRSRTEPQQMGADGDISCYAWYRTTISIPETSTYTIVFSNVGDRMFPFVDGKPVADKDVSSKSFTCALSAGSHTVTVFTAHSGRNKMFLYVGPIDNMYKKGLSGPVTLYRSYNNKPAEITSWKVMPVDNEPNKQSPPDAGAAGWSDYQTGEDVFHNKRGYAWIQTELPSDFNTAKVKMISFAGVDDNAWVYLNGKEITSHNGWTEPFNVDLTKFWNDNGRNILTVLVQNEMGKGGITSPATLNSYKDYSAINDWFMKGGPGDPFIKTGWKPLTSDSCIGPKFFQTTFTASPPQGAGGHPIWRVNTSTLSQGSVWVNGHNLGRYPQTNRAPGVYIPECWLKPGQNANKLVIFDESGNSPESVEVQAEEAASKDDVTLVSRS